MGWTDESVETLKRMWVLDRTSTSQCAISLNELYGTNFTKNSIIGKVNRLGLAYKGGAREVTPRTREARSAPEIETKSLQAEQKPHRDFATAKIVLPQKIATPTPRVEQPIKAPPAPRRPVTSALTPPPLLATDFVGPDAIRSLTDSERGKACRWPMGDPRDSDFRFCNHTYLGTGSYCAHHARIAYQPASGGRRRATEEASARKFVADSPRISAVG